MSYPKTWTYAQAVQNNGPNYYAITTGKWGAPTIAQVYGNEATASVIAAAPALLQLLRSGLEGGVFSDAPTFEHDVRTVLAHVIGAS